MSTDKHINSRTIEWHNLLAKACGLKQQPNSFSPAFIMYKWVQVLGSQEEIEKYMMNKSLNKMDKEKILLEIYKNMQDEQTKKQIS